jgi:uncharacterized membrane protein YgdD (TMEM256/DUF423 family)
MKFGQLGAISAFLGVLAGAFGAHAMRAHLTAERLQVFETGVRYQLFHALAMVLVGIALERTPRNALRAAGWLFVAGSVLFCGSLYALALTGQRALGAITPLGGLCFLAGWTATAMGMGTRKPR